VGPRTGLDGMEKTKFLTLPGAELVVRHSKFGTTFGFSPQQFSILASWGGVRLSPLGTSATTGLLYQPRMTDDDDDERRAVGGTRIGRINRSTRNKTCPSDTLSTTNPI
jgi:hypothetical protein